MRQVFRKSSSLAYEERFAALMTRRSGEGLGLGLGFEGESVVVTSVEPRSPAALADLRIDDLIVDINGMRASRRTISSLLPPHVDVFELGIMRAKVPDQPLELPRMLLGLGSSLAESSYQGSPRQTFESLGVQSALIVSPTSSLHSPDRGTRMLGTIAVRVGADWDA